MTHGTQMIPRIRIDPRAGTAADGALWTEESLPPETELGVGAKSAAGYGYWELEPVSG